MFSVKVNRPWRSLAFGRPKKTFEPFKRTVLSVQVVIAPMHSYQETACESAGSAHSFRLFRSLKLRSLRRRFGHNFGAFVKASQAIFPFAFGSNSGRRSFSV